MAVDTTRVFVADDHDIVIQGVTTIIDRIDEMRIVGTATSGTGLIEMIRQAKPDVLLCDLRMPDFDIYHLVGEFEGMKTSPHVIVVSAHLDRMVVHDLLGYGVSGYLLKEDALSKTLTAAIRTVMNDRFYTSPQVTTMLRTGLQPGDRTALTPKQTEMVRYLVRGYDPAAIALETRLSRDAVYARLSRIRKKLGMESNGQVILYAIEHGLGD